MTNFELEQILIEAAHSNENASQFMLNHLNNADVFNVLLSIVENSESGDARMEGAYYLSKCDVKLLSSVEDNLLNLVDDEWDSVAVHIMIALSRMKSQRGLKKIIQNRIKPNLAWEAKALENYFLE